VNAAATEQHSDDKTNVTAEIDLVNSCTANESKFEEQFTVFMNIIHNGAITKSSMKR
jgi:hypothetical protein